MYTVKRNVFHYSEKPYQKLMKKIYEKQVKTIYILLDSDAYWDSIKMTDVIMKWNRCSINKIER